MGIILLIIYILAVFVLMALILFFYVTFFLSWWHGTLFLPTKKSRVTAFLEICNLNESDTMYDLGCGDGRILIAARQLGVGQAVGYEIGWWPFLIARLLTRKDQGISIFRRHLEDATIENATMIYIYLFPQVTQRVARLVSKKCKQGTNLLSIQFPVENWHLLGLRLLTTKKVDTITAYLYQKI